MTALMDDLSGCSILILLLKSRAVRHKDVSCLFKGFRSISIAFFIKAALFLFSDFADHLTVKVLNGVEVIKYRLDMGTLFLKSLLEIRVYVAGNGFHAVHPFQTHMINEVIDYLLLLSVPDPRDVSTFQINDVCGIFAAIMELKPINARILSLFFRLYKFFAAVGSINVPETLLSMSLTVFSPSPVFSATCLFV